MHARIGDGVEPLPSGGIESAKVGELQPSEKVFFHVPHRVFYPAFLIALADIARGNGKTAVRGKVEIFWIEHWRFTQRAGKHGRFQVIDHDFVRNAAKELKG